MTLKKIAGPIQRVEVLGEEGIQLFTHEGLVTNDIVHHRVHQSMLFHGGRSASVANGANVDVRIRTGTKETHFVAHAVAAGQSTLFIYEDANISGGTPISLWNMRRSATNVSETKAYHTPTVTSVGSTPLINGRLLPGGTTAASRVGGEARVGTEWILKPNTEYLLRLTNGAGAAAIQCFVFEFYEETEA